MSLLPSKSHDSEVAPHDSVGTALPLLVIAVAQLMLVLDDTIVNIALPTIQNELGIPAGNLSWVINAYILGFGGLLLFGGRMGDVFGRRRVLQWGMGIFTLASLLVGLANGETWLIATRGLQGVGAAMTAPNALALIATTFPDGKPRNRAVAVYGAMSGVGLIAGLLLGGALTSFAGWRWVFFINVPIGLLVLAGSRTLVEAELHRGKLNIAAALSSIGGMLALIYGITRGGERGWMDAVTLGAFALAIVLLSLFALAQARSRNPLMPLGLFRDRDRTGSYAAMLLLAFGPMGTLYLMTLYMQDILMYSPLQTGLAWLPFGVGIVSGSVLTTKLAARRSPRMLAVVGILVASASMFWFSLIGPVANYPAHLMPAMFCEAFGFVMGVLALTLTAARNVQAQDTGIASALLNASQQIGVAFGVAILSTVAVSVTNGRLVDALRQLHEGRAAGKASLVQSASEALIHGYSTALAAGALAIALAAVIAGVLLRAMRAPDSFPQTFRK